MVETFLATLIEVAADVLFDVILALLTVLLAWVGFKVGTNTKLENINAAKAEVDEAVFQTVSELQQTVVDELKASAKDGKLTPEEISVLGQAVLVGVINKLSKPSENLLRAAGVDLEAYIKGAAEKWVATFKH